MQKLKPTCPRKTKNILHPISHRFQVITYNFIRHIGSRSEKKNKQYKEIISKSLTIFANAHNLY